jgi:hypothetical protein
MIIQDYVGLDVTGLVQAMVNYPDTAHGFAIRTEVEIPTRGLFFCGAGFSDPSKRPRLRIKFSSSVGVPESASSEGAVAYPNPVPTGTPLRLFVPAKQDVDAVVIFDGSGRTVYTTKIERGATDVLVQETLAPGVYRVIVKDPKGVVIRSSSVIVIDG